MIDYETKQIVREAAYAVKDFVAIHRQSLVELGAVLTIVGMCAGAVFAAVLAIPAPETRCFTAASVPMLPMPSDEPERKWQWPLAESAEDAAVEPTVATDADPSQGDEPAPRHHRRRHHWRRG